MDSIRGTITRVARRAKAFELKSLSLKKPNIIRTAHNPRLSIPSPKYPVFKMTDEIMAKTKTNLSNYEKKRFQEFLEPLGIDNLKLFNESLAAYDETLAKKNWELKNSGDNIKIYQSFLNSQQAFNGMMELLEKLTPEYLKGEKADANTEKYLVEHETELKRKKYEVPKYYFKEIPSPNSIPTKEEFDQYIYFLTHSRILSNNASSLSGSVSDILLYTHKLDNDKFKSLRSVDSYNNVIYWYGYKKNQSLFARTILMTMEKDGVEPNIETINNLLKIVNLHSQIRSVADTFALIVKYLRICQHFKLSTNLVTWNRVYNLINNLYLKELFLNKISMLNLPVTKDLTYSMVDDYMKICRDEKDLQNFVNRELLIVGDSKIGNKLLFYKMKNSIDLKTSVQEYSPNNEFSVQYVLNGIIRNPNYSSAEKVQFMLQVFTPQVETIAILMKELNNVSCDITCINILANHLLYEFHKISGADDYEQSITFLKSVCNASYELILKFNHHGLKFFPQIDSRFKQRTFDITKENVIAEKLIRSNRHKRIRSINKRKLATYNSTIESRLEDRGLI